jgi:hypothetical protein
MDVALILSVFIALTLRIPTVPQVIAKITAKNHAISQPIYHALLHSFLVKSLYHDHTARPNHAKKKIIATKRIIHLITLLTVSIVIPIDSKLLGFCNAENNAINTIIAKISANVPHQIAIILPEIVGLFIICC